MSNLVENDGVLQALSGFLDDLLRERGADPKSQDGVRMKHDLQERLDTAINTVFVEYVPEEKQEELKALLEGKDREKLQEFVRAHVPNLDQAVSAMLQKFREAYLGV
ncbi:hypothetical protein A3J43_02115 [Candidatus Uhrbacteria bacterium RIFCSPHIGHO2_12_FULL_54_23]|uniref:Uncharacterized protein n=2 Tax=Candidatus Uhriibacteriota TaxID=1752732 RepID=A0A1F7UMF0_9BACT|nr:MAG: hypothetical protein A3J43_02115 [Candidatus Uhrbacteria bacterium RIFCSPHIGHO2_12_FULL_54_23]OGL90123.1 MAG: hypothetical protein A3J36_02345 [Candidatus Uhrbacteria bacterium RIFCSPLOWO2_02_FULL_54_37]